MQIGEIASATGLSRDTLRFYEKRGLLRARRSANGYRDYPPEAVNWLRYIKLAQTLGFTLGEIEADLPLLAEPASSAPQLRAALARKLEDIDQRIEGLHALRGELARRLAEDMQACPLQPGQADSHANLNDYSLQGVNITNL
ncbi:MerR family transcriptional regulator [Duganella vulcania]|uniref:MerR family transcriptional regulator n=1 Tax=Duganella vulcania TaxID=2692166 RepID=UPI0020C403E1|nr:MerR family transcriptional regulator [Duganella vulcania]